MVSTSLKSLDEIRAVVWFLCQEKSFEAWKAAWSSTCTGIQCEGVKPFFINSILVAIPAVIISTFIGAINGYELLNGNFWFKFNIFVNAVWCFIPFQVILYHGKAIRNNEHCWHHSRSVFVHVIYGIGLQLYFSKFLCNNITRNS